jgi:hypothetical protein
LGAAVRIFKPDLFQPNDILPEDIHRADINFLTFVRFFSILAPGLSLAGQSGSKNSCPGGNFQNGFGVKDQFNTFKG